METHNLAPTKLLMAASMYSIPAKYRRMENMHILFWLVKDISWCLIWKVLGMAMIFPTLIVAILISWRTRNVASELAHNLAVIFWITANSYWMISEFFGFDDLHIWGPFDGKHLALIPFLTGLVILIHFYVFGKRDDDPGQGSK
jgi:hypothetical protein